MSTIQETVFALVQAFVNNIQANNALPDGPLTTLRRILATWVDHYTNVHLGN